jgi:hypothetical protein
MLVTRKSQWSGKLNQLELPVTAQQIEDWRNGRSGLIQQAFPQLTADQREFLMTGVTAQEWEEMFPEGEED